MKTPLPPSTRTMTKATLSERERKLRRRLRDDFEIYARKCLIIRPKEGATIPFRLNSAQRYIHEQAENQRRRTGRVRKIVLKGRQQGCSTYIEGRFYWRVTHRRGVRAFILAHEAEATSNLFEMAERYHEHCPEPVRPQTGTASAKELYFDALDSGYRIATAGTRGAGRSGTWQYFHGSEVAYWRYAESHAGGAMQAVPDQSETEIWLESTANGEGNFFHIMWEKAVRGDGAFEPIFVPWFWQTEYRRPVPLSWKRTEAERPIAERFKLDDEQLAWRRNKIAELDNRQDGDVRSVTGEDSFRREYPNTPEEAFAAPILGAYYADLLQAAQDEGRIANVPYNPAVRVTTAWDMGIADDMVIWFAQCVGREIRIIDYYENRGLGLDHYAKVVTAKPYAYAEHLLPHDAGQREQGTGTSREETLRSLEIGQTRVLPLVGKSKGQEQMDGIARVRQILPQCWFDEKKCARGLRALKHYRREYDDERRAFQDLPYHDWTSHAADGFRCLARGIGRTTDQMFAVDPTTGKMPAIKYPKVGVR